MRFAQVLGTLLIFTCGTFARAQTAPTGDATRGQKQFSEFGCWQCHGTSGAGGGWQGPKLAPNPVAYAAFAYQLRAPRAQMPRYAPHLLSDKDVADIYAYLRSIPAGRPANQIDLLKR